MPPSFKRADAGLTLLSIFQQKPADVDSDDEASVLDTALTNPTDNSDRLSSAAVLVMYYKTTEPTSICQLIVVFLWTHFLISDIIQIYGYSISKQGDKITLIGNDYEAKAMIDMVWNGGIL